MARKYDVVLHKSTAGFHYAEFAISQTGTYTIKAKLILKTDLKMTTYHVHTLHTTNTKSPRKTLLCTSCNVIDENCTPSDSEIELVQDSTLFVGFLFVEHPPKSQRVHLQVELIPL